MVLNRIKIIEIIIVIIIYLVGSVSNVIICMMRKLIIIIVYIINIVLLEICLNRSFFFNELVGFLFFMDCLFLVIIKLIKINNVIIFSCIIGNSNMILGDLVIVFVIVLFILKWIGKLVGVIG